MLDHEQMEAMRGDDVVLPVMEWKSGPKGARSHVGLSTKADGLIKVSVATPEGETCLELDLHDACRLRGALWTAIQKAAT